jgi:NitT/TauT family transport system substrate-binding protein
MRYKYSRRKAAALLAGVAVLGPAEMKAGTKTIRLAKQFGISYLPLTVMEHEKLLEEHCKKAGFDVATDWLQFTGGAPINEAVISGNLDIAAGGVGPMLTLWGRTRTNIGVKGVAALNSMPLFLVTTKASVKTIADFTDHDRIALPGIKTSIQAITLQMAAEKVFGVGQHTKLDHITVSMGHPDAEVAMLGGHSEIDAHFASAPFMYDELKDSRVHKVLDSYDVLGGPHTFNLVWATSGFAEQNPQILGAFRNALSESMEMIVSDPRKAAAIWVESERSKLSVADAANLIQLPENAWTMTPQRTMAYAAFMSRTGVIPAKPGEWKELFFDAIHNLPGS